MKETMYSSWAMLLFLLLSLTKESFHKRNIAEEGQNKNNDDDYSGYKHCRNVAKRYIQYNGYSWHLVFGLVNKMRCIIVWKTTFYLH